MPRVSILPTPKQKLTREEKLKIEVDGSTRKPGHEETYAKLADIASETHEQRVADHALPSPLHETTNAVMNHDIEQRRRRSLRDLMRVTNGGKEGE